MGYKLIKSDEKLVDGLTRPVVFLGGASKGRMWRTEFLQRFEKMSVTFLSTRRVKFADPEMDPVRHAEQVMWDRQALDSCDVAVFWLGEGLSNQASRVEIGYALGKGKTVVIGADDTFLGLEHLTGFSGLVLSSTVDGLMNRLSSLLANYNS